MRALASRYGAEGVCLGSTKAHNATQSNSPGNPHEGSAKEEATHKKAKQEAGREASWLKEVKKVKRVGKSEKWVTRPRGGEE